jgi:ankyrin repeat protein
MTSPAWQGDQTDLNSLIENGCTPQDVRDFLDRLPPLQRENTVNLKNGGGWTPLRAAVTFRQGPEALSIVRILLENGANPLVGNDRKGDFNSVHEACRRGKVELVQELCTRCPVAASKCTKDSKMYPIHYAAESKIAASRTLLVKLLASQFKVSASVLNVDLNSPLHYAGAKRDHATFQILKQMGLDENVPNRWGHTALDKLNGH